VRLSHYDYPSVAEFRINASKHMQCSEGKFTIDSTVRIGII